MPFSNKKRITRNRFVRHLAPPRARQAPRDAIAGELRKLRGAVGSSLGAVRRAVRRAAAETKVGEDAEAKRDLINTLTGTAASFRAVAAHLEGEARAAVSAAAEARKELPKLLAPRRETIAGTPVLLFEFGQPITVREAFAAALELEEAETTVGKIGEARGFLPRAAADALAKTSEVTTVLLTRLRNSERRFMVWPGKRPRQTRAKRGGALAVACGRSEKFYFPGIARMPAGTRIALPAAAVPAL